MSRRRPALAPVLMLVGPGLLAGCSREPSMLDAKSPTARDIAGLFWLMTGLGTAVFVLVVGLLIAVVVRGRRAHAEPGPEQEARRSTWWVVGGGVVLPLVVVVPLSVLTLFVLDHHNDPADDALVVHVDGHRFWWSVAYPAAGVVTANEIHLPVDRDVRLVLTSGDVIHSFWVPNLAGKRDLIPGEVVDLTFRPDEVGVYGGACAEFCGIQHAWMRLLVVVETQDEFDRWLLEQATPAPLPDTEEERFGLATFLEVGCASCHRIQGTPAEGDVGPDLTHLAMREWLGAGVVPNTRGHLGGWVANPQNIKPGVAMPPTPLTGPQLTSLLAYLETLE